MDLSRFRGRNRLLSIFAPSASDEGPERQRDLLERHEAGFADRDLLALRLFEDGWFAAVLVGRDGRARFRSDEPVRAPDLFARIDAMPMRGREMREKSRG